MDMYQAVTHDIEVSVLPQYLDDRSNPDENYYVWAYTVLIENKGSETVTLRTRHWEIIDANGQRQDVDGEGVIGKQPYLKPGESFEYSSGTILETPVGAMQGHYDMTSDDGSQFKANIAPFTLSVPGSLH